MENVKNWKKHEWLPFEHLLKSKEVKTSTFILFARFTFFVWLVSLTFNRLFLFFSRWKLNCQHNDPNSRFNALNAKCWFDIHAILMRRQPQVNEQNNKIKSKEKCLFRHKAKLCSQINTRRDKKKTFHLANKLRTVCSLSVLFETEMHSTKTTKTLNYCETIFCIARASNGISHFELSTGATID